MGRFSKQMAGHLSLLLDACFQFIYTAMRRDAIHTVLVKEMGEDMKPPDILLFYHTAKGVLKEYFTHNYLYDT